MYINWHAAAGSHFGKVFQKQLLFNCCCKRVSESRKFLVYINWHAAAGSHFGKVFQKQLLFNFADI